MIAVADLLCVTDRPIVIFAAVVLQILLVAVLSLGLQRARGLSAPSDARVWNNGRPFSALENGLMVQGLIGGAACLMLIFTRRSGTLSTSQMLLLSATVVTGLPALFLFRKLRSRS